jgi:phenylalanyl-tRNA synthetase alpha chain
MTKQFRLRNSALLGAVAATAAAILLQHDSLPSVVMVVSAFQAGSALSTWGGCRSGSSVVRCRDPPLGRLHDSSSPPQATSTAEQDVSIEDVSAELRSVKAQFDERMAQATTSADAEAVRREYLGKKGPLSKVMGYMRLLSPEDKPKLGAVVNEIKQELESCVAERLKALEREEILRKMEADRIDATLPGTSRMADIGHRHPLSITMERAVDIFTSLGYDTVTQCKDSPEVETDYNCFEALNSPKDHPARDMQDTFYLTEDMEWLLRSHTSSVQIRQLAKRSPPLRIVAPGRVYRKDDIDATHSLMFHQVEILALEKKGELNLGHLKGTVEHFLKNMFGPDIQIRFRGSYFPFTEPSMEVDVFFKGKWMEVLGCGMVDPNVLEKAGIDPNEYSGFAAGFGVERFAMVIYGISDLREFYKNDKRFLQQFPFFYDDGTCANRLVSTLLLLGFHLTTLSFWNRGGGILGREQPAGRRSRSQNGRGARSAREQP